MKISKIYSENEWKFFINLLKESFPSSEYRNINRIRTISDLNTANFIPCIIYGDNNEMLGLISYWDFRKESDFLYFEHLAFLPSLRNNGMGTKILSMIKEIHHNIIYEVEDAGANEMSKRRIEFYLRNGARMSDIAYAQPPYSFVNAMSAKLDYNDLENLYIPMRIMYFGKEPSAYDVDLMANSCYPNHYVLSQILPQYESFDAAHRRGHIEEVISKSFEIYNSPNIFKSLSSTLDSSSTCTLDEDVIFFAAAFHDIGIPLGRELHHINSAKIFREDANICRWFSSEEIRIISEAIEDHRSSKGAIPRSIYGKILAEADRTIDPDKIISRTIQFGKANYPSLSREEHFERFKGHLMEKYSKTGYLKLLFNDTENSRNLEKLQAIIEDEGLLRDLFNLHIND